MFGIFKNQSRDNGNLQEIIKNGAFLVDVREPGEFSSGSVKGAVNIPLNTIQGHLHKFRDKKSIVVFCRSGNRSSQAKVILERNGLTEIFNGGTWQNVNTIVNGK